MGAYTVSRDGYPSAEARLPVFRGTRSPYPSNGYPGSEGRAPPFRGSEKPLTRGTATHFTSAGYTPLPRKWLYLFRGTGFPRPRGRNPLPLYGSPFSVGRVLLLKSNGSPLFRGAGIRFPRQGSPFAEEQVPLYRGTGAQFLSTCTGVAPSCDGGLYIPLVPARNMYP
jgi:hypothetical protein